MTKNFSLNFVSHGCKSWIIALLGIIFAYGHANSKAYALEGYDIDINVPYGSNYYQFTPEFDGVVTIKLSAVVNFSQTAAPKGDTWILYDKTPSASAVGLDAIEHNGGNIQGDAYRQFTQGKWHVTGGTLYNIYLPYYSGTLNVHYEQDEDPNVEKFIVFNDNQWFPAGETNYYFTPKSNGTIRCEIYKNGAIQKLSVPSFLFSDESAEALEISDTDADGTLSNGTTYRSPTYFEYTLQPDTKYYFYWTKNKTSNDYSILVTWYETEFKNNIEHGESEETAIPYKASDFNAGTQVSYDNRQLELTGEGGVTLEGPNDYSEDVRHEINETGTELQLHINENFNKLLDENKYDRSKLHGIYKVTIKRGTIAIENAINEPTEIKAVKALSLSDPTYNEEHQLYYYISVPTGVKEILSADENGLYKVYNLQGVNVLNTDNALDLNYLPKGIYIVNGKKIII